MISQYKIVVVAILLIAVCAFICVNDATHAASPNKPTCVAPANEAVFEEYGSIPFKSSTFDDPDIDDDPIGTTWRIKRFDADTIYRDFVMNDFAVGRQPNTNP